MPGETLHTSLPDIYLLYVIPILVALLLGLLGQWAPQPTPEELGDFRDRICASQEADR